MPRITPKTPAAVQTQTPGRSLRQAVAEQLASSSPGYNARWNALYETSRPLLVNQGWSCRRLVTWLADNGWIQANETKAVSSAFYRRIRKEQGAERMTQSI